jgi:uncharacterized protein YabE (DUF348 family)
MAKYVSTAAAVAVLGGAVATYIATDKTVTVQDNGQRRVVRGFTTGSLGAFLKKQGIVIKDDERVSENLSGPVKNGMVVKIEDPLRIRIDQGGVTHPALTFAKTVTQFLQQEGITIGVGDQLVQSPVSKLRDGETISIHHTTRKVSTKAQDIPFQTIRQRSDKLLKGQEHVLTYGVKGSLEVKTTSVFVDGHRVGQTVEHHVTKSPTNQILLIGTTPRPVRISSRSYTPGAIAGALTVYATAYVGGGHTATGWLAQPGVIAVDPAVIPLGTKLYIPGIGIVAAEDTGGAIVGNRIDICVSSEQSAEVWGGRTITIYFVK